MRFSLLGRRQQRGGWSVLLLVLALFSCISAFTLVVLGVPYTWLRARTVQALPQPAYAELSAFAPGKQALFVAQVPPDAQLGDHDLALFYVEVLVAAEDDAATGEETPSTAANSWTVQIPPPRRYALWLSDGQTLIVNIPEDTAFENAQRYEEEDERSTVSRRVVGYLPGQTLTFEGMWEGDNLVTARSFFAGSPDGYVTFLQHQPGQSFLSGLVCAGVSLVSLVTALIARLLGK